MNGHSGNENAVIVSSLANFVKRTKQSLFEQPTFKLSEPQMLVNIKPPKTKPEYLDCINNRIVAAESL